MSNISPPIGEQTHGYRSGHQLLSTTLRLERADQDVVDRLSDMAGQLRPGETFAPYITGYPLPGGSHFVLAKTWQDLLAPRSGCVWTHSLLIPTSGWSALADVTTLLGLFREPHPASSLDRNDQPTAHPLPVLDPRRFELVEALFLEERRPIVMFDCAEAETIALRVVNSLLSGLRPEFAFGTYTLAPRSIAGRPFDLLFAPSDARSRFAGWTGRRIERAKSSGNKGRHRWTADLVDQIFERTGGRLEVEEALGFSPDRERIDEGSLRLSLRWRELVHSASASPTAALGLLDILNARGRVPLDETARLFPVLINAVTQAVANFSPEEAWTYLTALLSKFPRGRIPSPLRKHLYWAVTLLTAKAPRVALQYVASVEGSDRAMPPLFESWIGDGIAKSGAESWLFDLPDHTLGRLVTSSRALARHLIDQTRIESDNRYLSMLISSALQSTVSRRRRLLRSTACRLDRAHFAPLLQAMLEGMPGRDVARAATDIGRSTDFAIAAFDAAFPAATEFDADVLRAAILEFEPNENSDRFLSTTLSLRPVAIDWICQEAALDETRKAHVLRLVIENADERRIRSLAKDPDRLVAVLRLLSAESPRNAAIIARLVLLKPISSQSEFMIARSVLPHVDSARRSFLSDALLAYALVADTCAPEVVGSLMREFIAAGHSAEELIHKSVPAFGNERLLSRNVLALLGSSELRPLLVPHVSLLSSILMRRALVYGDNIYRAWAGLISDAIARRAGDVDSLAKDVLAYALRSTSAPASPLIVATFPAVYRMLRAAESRSSVFGFDKAKWLARDLAQAFIRSSWLPEDLIRCAVLSGDPKAIFKHVGEAWRGDEYMERLERSATLLPAAQHKEALRSMPSKSKKR